MTLKYRGVAYQPQPITVSPIQTESLAKYRGQSYLLRQFLVPIENSDTCSMIYRGVSYNKVNFSSPQSIPQISINSSLA
ncbi:MAG: DUF4278 domain-containing protein [Xenococcus sp. (in: cyanobacteria)]